MTQKEIDELRARIYSISNCMFPLDTFFNDIRDNKESSFDKNRAYNDLKLITDVIYELKEKEQEYHLEEVKKEWEDDGWVWIDKNDGLINIKHKKDVTKDILIYTSSKDYISLWHISFKEHIRLTKTFRALGWEV